MEKKRVEPRCRRTCVTFRGLVPTLTSAMFWKESLSWSLRRELGCVGVLLTATDSI